MAFDIRGKSGSRTSVENKRFSGTAVAGTNRSDQVMTNRDEFIAHEAKPVAAALQSEIGQKQLVVTVTHQDQPVTDAEVAFRLPADVYSDRINSRDLIKTEIETTLSSYPPWVTLGKATGNRYPCLIPLSAGHSDKPFRTDVAILVFDQKFATGAVAVVPDRQRLPEPITSMQLELKPLKLIWTRVSLYDLEQGKTDAGARLSATQRILINNGAATVAIYAVNRSDPAQRVLLGYLSTGFSAEWSFGVNLPPPPDGYDYQLRVRGEGKAQALEPGATQLKWLRSTSQEFSVTYNPASGQFVVNQGKDLRLKPSWESR